MKEEYVLIPKQLINRLEQARKLFWLRVEEGLISPGESCGITDIMWTITHRKFETIEKETQP